MKVSLAVAEIFRELAKSDEEMRERLIHTGVLPSLSRLASECNSLSELVTVIPAICSIFDRPTYSNRSQKIDSGILEAIDEQLLKPLLSCLTYENTDIRMGACMALRCLSSSGTVACLFQKNVVPHLALFLSTDSDEVFTAAASVLFQWVYNIESESHDYANFDIIRRLVPLLSHKDDHVVLGAILGIRYANHIQVNNLALVMVEAGGVQPLIGLLSSRNMDVVQVTLEIFYFMTVPGNSGDRFAIGYFVRQGIISVLSLWLSSGSHPLLPKFLWIIWFWVLATPDVGKALVQAGAIPHLVECARRALDDGGRCDLDDGDPDDYEWHKRVLENRLPHPRYDHCSGDDDAIIDVIVELIKYSREARMEFRATSAESVLVNHLSVYGGSELEEALRMLREDKTTPV